MKDSNSFSDNSFATTIVSLVLYTCWWGYIFYFLYGKEYDNNYAEATASIGLGGITILIVVVYIIGFTVAAIKERKKTMLYLYIVPLLLTPIIGIFLFEYLK